ncbi:HAD domain-containing protein [Paraburkholderia sediminicola]|uniref:HAD domain-containing protein n=1 Tax=Paraburkholderia sediminicola TaxID=458836 RepID=UPI0038B8A564
MNEDSTSLPIRRLGDNRGRKPITADSAVLYTDLDHTLHRTDAYRTRHGLVSGSPDTPFFEYAPVLEHHLAGYPDVVIVLSTAWVQELGFEETCAKFPTASLRERIVDSTYDPHDDLTLVWSWVPRGVQILRHVQRCGVKKWLALDDDSAGFEGHEARLIHCQREVGLGDTDVQALLVRRLESMFGSPGSASTTGASRKGRMT